jgi:hypothetical protein
LPVLGFLDSACGEFWVVIMASWRIMVAPLDSVNEITGRLDRMSEERPESYKMPTSVGILEHWPDGDSRYLQEITIGVRGKGSRYSSPPRSQKEVVMPASRLVVCR